MNKTILMTGWKGIVGTALTNIYKQHGYDIVSFDEDFNIQDACLLHLAAKFTDDIYKITNSNILYMKKVVDYAQRNNIRKFIFFSAMRVYGQQNKEDITENDPVVNPEIYGLSKLFGEKILERSGVNALVLRLPGILTKNSRTDFLSKCMDKFTQNEDVAITNAHKVFNNFIFIDSIFEFLTSVELKKKFDIINLSVKKELTLLQIMEFLKERVQSKSNIIMKNENQSFFNISTEKAMNEYGFQPMGAKESLVKWCESRNT